MKRYNLVLAMFFSIIFSGLVSAHGGHDDAFSTQDNTSSKQRVELSPEGKRAIGVNTTQVESSFLNKYMDVTGQVSVANDKHYDISLAVSGLVKEVFVQEGDKVNKGQKLATIQSLEATQILKELLKQKTNIEKEVQVLSNELTVKESTYLREKTLVDEGISPRKDLQEAESLYQSAKASLDARKKELNFIISSTKSELSIMGFSQGIVDQAINSGTIDPNINIYSPINGTISVRNISPGESIQSSATMLSIDNLKPIWINIDIYQDQIPEIKLGQAVKIISSSNEELEGKIANIANVIDPNSRTLAVRIVSENKDETLKPGMMVSAKILLGQSSKEVLVIPINAIITKQDKSLTFIDHGDYYQAVELKLGDQDSSKIEVLEGLKLGDEIVIQGGEQIYSESLLKPNSGGSKHTHHHSHKSKKQEIPWSIIITILISSAVTSAFWFLRLKKKDNK